MVVHGRWREDGRLGELENGDAGSWLQLGHLQLDWGCGGGREPAGEEPLYPLAHLQANPSLQAFLWGRGQRPYPEVLGSALQALLSLPVLLGIEPQC